VREQDVQCEQEVFGGLREGCERIRGGGGVGGLWWWESIHEGR